MSNMQEALRLLEQEDYTCVLVCEKERLTSRERGITPLWNWYREGRRLDDFVAADKVVGKAAAYLYVVLGVKEVYAKVLSQPALEVFSDFGVNATYETLTEAIRNRAGTGFCPMETAVQNAKTIEEALALIEKKRRELSSS